VSFDETDRATMLLAVDVFHRSPMRATVAVYKPHLAEVRE
jgi:hypothetical protein